MTGNKINIDSLTRQERLLIWLRRSGLQYREIAERTGVKTAAVSKWFDGDTIPPYRHQQLVDLGIPADLLPLPVYKAGGQTYPVAAQ